MLGSWIVVFTLIGMKLGINIWEYGCHFFVHVLCLCREKFVDVNVNKNQEVK